MRYVWPYLWRIGVVPAVGLWLAGGVWLLDGIQCPGLDDGGACGVGPRILLTVTGTVEMAMALAFLGLIAVEYILEPAGRDVQRLRREEVRLREAEERARTPEAGALSPGAPPQREDQGD